MFHDVDGCIWCRNRKYSESRPANRFSALFRIIVVKFQGFRCCECVISNFCFVCSGQDLVDRGNDQLNEFARCPRFRAMRPRFSALPPS